MELRAYKVWDRSQRIFHWANALAVLKLAAIGIVILPFGGTFREWVAADTHDPARATLCAGNHERRCLRRDARVSRAAGQIHEYNFFVSVAMIVIHVAAAVIVEFKEGGAVISSMFTGRRPPHGGFDQRVSWPSEARASQCTRTSSFLSI
jgi:cytochrome b